MQASDLADLINSLEDLRVRRRELNDSLDNQEAVILRRLTTGSSQNLTNRASNQSQEGSISEGEIQLHRQSFRYRPIPSNASLQPGDRVKVINALAHISGPIDQEDRLATVTKVHRVFIEVQTDSGHVIKRKRKNLHQLAF